jgi:hypothetical protein
LPASSRPQPTKQLRTSVPKPDTAVSTQPRHAGRLTRHPANPPQPIKTRHPCKTQNPRLPFSVLLSSVIPAQAGIHDFLLAGLITNPAAQTISYFHSETKSDRSTPTNLFQVAE